ncbi:MAG: hypothetical protein WCR52_19895 [Bacteroidota bacterium]
MSRILPFLFLFLFSCDDKESNFQETSTIQIGEMKYEYNLRSVGILDCYSGIKGRYESLYVKNIDKINFDDVNEQINFRKFIYAYLENSDSIPKDERLRQILVFHKYYKHDFITSEMWYLHINFDSIQQNSRYVIKDIIRD